MPVNKQIKKKAKIIEGILMAARWGPKGEATGFNVSSHKEVEYELEIDASEAKFLRSLVRHRVKLLVYNLIKIDHKKFTARLGEVLTTTTIFDDIPLDTPDWIDMKDYDFTSQTPERAS